MNLLVSFSVWSSQLQPCRYGVSDAQVDGGCFEGGWVCQGQEALDFDSILFMVVIVNGEEQQKQTDSEYLVPVPAFIIVLVE